MGHIQEKERKQEEIKPLKRKEVTTTIGSLEITNHLEKSGSELNALNLMGLEWLQKYIKS